RRSLLLLAVVVATWASAGHAIERLALSGSGPGDAVEWEFRVSSGRRAAEWSTIQVPQQWELAGFGSYAYGFDESTSDEVGEYRHRFNVPESWRDRRLDLVFEGVMTDAEVKLNGALAGPAHRGGFTRFRYDITELVMYGEANMIEVTVRERSRDESVNRAERDADYWVFGGIYRPVYLEARPRDAIVDVAIDAHHGGRLRVGLELEGELDRATLLARVLDQDELAVATFSEEATAGRTVFDWQVSGVKAWTAETPRLYTLEVALVKRGSTTHRRDFRFGFRTFVIDADRGLLINGQKVRLRGINRQSFWPESGRALDPAVNRRDVELLKGMNANAVRTSHYPADIEFLQACDELGLYVIAELPGWHDAYDTGVGRQIVEEMVRRDRSHPSILMWANGNEGGWNTDLDGEFARHDLQDRPVIHPDEEFGGLDTTHYLSWAELASSLDAGSRTNKVRRLLRRDLPLVLPTEILHGMWDGGHAAGLEAYWSLIRASPRGVGLFLWSFLDEAVVRTDLDGRLDTASNFAPDGIVGPHRELEGSYGAVRRIWSPVGVVGADLERGSRATVELENRFDHLDLDGVDVNWEWIELPRPGSDRVAVLANGLAHGPAVAPGSLGELSLESPPDGADALRLEFREGGRVVRQELLALASPAAPGPREHFVSGEVPRVERTPTGFLLAGGGQELRLTAAGSIATLTGDGAEIAFEGGPVPVPGPSVSRCIAARLDSSTTVDFRCGADEWVRWTVKDDGWVRVDYRFWPRGRSELVGARLLLDPLGVEGLRWLGEGRYRVWENRPASGPLGLWTKTVNDTSTGAQWGYPEFRGFHAGVRWLDLDLGSARLLVVPARDDGFLGLFEPSFVEGLAPDGQSMARFARAETVAGLSFLDSISPIGTKFHRAAELAPPSRRPHRNSVEATLWMAVVPARSAPTEP
ncbi:MAG: glycoside hydrolase family 2 TIM barrel-domain containing protein, partial [Acidobacteriota bacterium]|nr:glycoside hydrolase family 2 TIM barrel-domain containing protein [Acidobacteriota bacterium]